MKSSLKVGIISGRFPATQYDSATNHKIYADYHGYTYIHCNWPTKAKNPYFNKLHYILTYFSLFEYIIWIDDDAFFYDFQTDIMKYAPQDDHFLSVCRSPSFKELKTYLSSGQFIVKCIPLAKIFIESVTNQNLNHINHWWKPSMGYFTRGDQDAMIYLLLTDPTYKDSYQLFDYKCFNSRTENLFNQDPHIPLILHLTGKPRVKRKNYLKIQRRFGLQPSLVSESVLKKYKVHSQNQNKGLSLKSLITGIKKWF